MAAQPFPYPKSSTPGSRPGEGEGRYMNCAPVVEGDRTYVRRVPGLTVAATAAASGIRGMIDVNGTLFIVWNGSVTAVNGSTVTTLSGSIEGSDGVTLARNNRVTDGVSTPQIVAVRESGGAYVISSGGVTPYPDGDLPAPNSVAFLGGFLIFSIADGRIFASELNSTDIEPLSFATAESRADGLRRVIVQGSLVYAMGSSTIEPYQNAGTMPFPLQRAATVIPVGLLTTMAVAGDEEAWNRALYFVASDNTVRALSGYETAIVSTADVERFVAASMVSTLELTVFNWAGTPYLAISSNIGTWVLNVASGAWHERVSAGQQRWRAKRSVFSGERWLFGDTQSGKLFTLSSALTEDGAPMGGYIQSGQLKAFPARIATKLSADFTEANMTIYVSWSHDGGKTWATELQRSITDAERWPLAVANLGLSTHHGIITKFRWAGSADFSFSGATADRLDVRQT